MNGSVFQSIIVGVVALFSALIGGYLPNLIQRKTKEREVKRIKLEEIYIDIEDWYNSAFNNMCIEFSLVMDGHIDWNEYLTRITSHEVKGDIKKSKILISLYFSELEGNIKKLHDSVVEMNRHINNEIKLQYLSGGDIGLLRSAHGEKIKDANKCMRDLQKQLHKIAKKL